MSNRYHFFFPFSYNFANQHELLQEHSSIQQGMNESKSITEWNASNGQNSEFRDFHKKDVVDLGKVAEFSLRSLFEKTNTDKRKQQQQLSEVEKQIDNLDKMRHTPSKVKGEDLPFDLKSKSVVFSMKTLIEKGRTKYLEEQRIEQPPTKTLEESKQQKQKYLLNVLKWYPAETNAKTASDIQVTSVDSDEGQDQPNISTCAAAPTATVSPRKETRSRRYSILKRLQNNKPYEKSRMKTPSEGMLQHRSETYSLFSKCKLLSNRTHGQEDFKEKRQFSQSKVESAQTDRESLRMRPICAQGSSMQRYLKASVDELWRFDYDMDISKLIIFVLKLNLFHCSLGSFECFPVFQTQDEK